MARLAEERLGRRFPKQLGAARHSGITREFSVRPAVQELESLPLIWWTRAVNFGDLLSPWLVRRMTGKPVHYAEEGERNVVAIGSIMQYVTPKSTVWGTGSYGNEASRQLCKKAKYVAVRGPLTRARLQSHEITCPEVYGDPALLAPLYYHPDVPVSADIGIIVRWSEREWAEAGSSPPPGVRVIDLLSDDIEGTIQALMGCKRIVSSSLHGLILADAYGVPNAWLASDTPAGRGFKFYDYFLSVDKLRPPHTYDLSDARSISVERIMDNFEFNAAPISLNLRRLLQACPWLERA